jgi:DNA polymerase
MAEVPDPRAAVVRQVKLHLEALKAAGVEFLPVTPPMTFAPAENAPLRVAANTEVGAEPAPLWGAAQQEPDPDSPDGRRHQLTVLAEQVAGCDRCAELFATRTQTVFGTGPVDPEVCFIGEAPGADEDASGEPFVGRAGQLLNKIIVAMGFKREEVYICNTLKCRPPNNRTPTPQERSHCREYFDAQLALVRPKYIVCLGATAAQNVIGTTLGIGKLRGRLHKYRDVPVVCTYHPSAILREEPAQTLRRACWEDMQMLLRTMGRPIQGAKPG